MTALFVTCWIVGWFGVGFYIVWSNRDTFGVFQSTTRFLLCFYFWPFVAAMLIYLKCRNEV